MTKNKIYVHFQWVILFAVIIESFRISKNSKKFHSLKFSFLIKRKIDKARTAYRIKVTSLIDNTKMHKTKFRKKEHQKHRRWGGIVRILSPRRSFL